MLGFAHAAVDDPIENWAPVDITYMDAQISNGYLTININLHDSLQNLHNRTRAIIGIFLDSDKDKTTGDYRLGAVAGTDFVIECSGSSFFISCMLHKLPHEIYQETESLHFSLIQDASIELSSKE